MTVEINVDATDPELLQFTPLAERVLSLVTGMPTWNFKVVAALFPNEHQKSLYRAIKHLEDEGKIRCLGWHGRTKQYTTKGISNLPVITTILGNKVDLKDLFPVIPNQYKDGRWIKLNEINNLFLSLGHLFVINNLEGEDFAVAYREYLYELLGYKKSLTEMLSYVNALLEHPIMNGDLKLFKKMLDGNTPDMREQNDFRLFVAELRRNNEAVSKSTINPDGS